MPQFVLFAIAGRQGSLRSKERVFEVKAEIGALKRLVLPQPLKLCDDRYMIPDHLLKRQFLFLDMCGVPFGLLLVPRKEQEPFSQFSPHGYDNLRRSIACLKSPSSRWVST